jgi:competence protein ComEC
MSLRRAVILAACLAAGFALNCQPPEPAMRVDFLAVGQGDCALIRTEGWTVLVDAAPRLGEWDAGARLAVPELRKLGVKSIDLVLLSHLDADHTGGFEAIRRRFPVGEAALPDRFEGREEAPDGVEWLPPRSRVRLGRVVLDLAHFDGADDNAQSLFVRASLGRSAVVFSGDTPASTEALAAAEGDWSGQVVKAGHHGSRGSLSAEWLAETGAQFVVFSAGRGNRFGHPHPEAVRRAEQAGAQTLTTADEGRISFRLHPNGRVERLP